MPQFEVHAIDIAVLATYILITRLGFGWYSARKARGGGSEGYFLAGRQLRWPIIGLSFYVANMSGSTFVALPASAYHDGIAVYTYEWMPAVILVFFAAFILPCFLRANIFTAPQFLETRYGTRPKLIFSVFLLLANIFIDAAAALYAGAMVFAVLFPDIPVWTSIGVMALLAGVYIFFGGLRAVVLNDVVQALMILLGGSVIAVLAWQAVPSWEAVAQQAPPRALHLVQPADDPNLPWPGMLSGVLIIGFYFWCANQFIIQRALGARSLADGRRGALFAGLLKLPNLFILILPGVMAASLYPDLENPDLAFPVLVFDLLPVGVRGLMLAALAAAILSSLEAILNSAATLFTIDLVKQFRPGISDSGLVQLGRASTLIFMLLAAAWAPQITRFPTLWQYLQSILAYVTPPVVAVFLFGIFWKRASHAGAMATLLVGLPAGLAGWIGVEVLELYELQFLYAAGLLFALAAVLMIVASLARPQARAAPAVCHATAALWSEGDGRFWRPGSFRLQAVLLLILTAAIVITWW
jgi:SSS family solute:Na+ symporter